MPWGFPIFIGTNTVVDSWRKYAPKSDLMVPSAGHLIPFFVSEVISLKVAVYLDKEMVASRYIVTQTG
ncbi:hypothetical protein PISMIDRAFT_350046 [Pisolithus microcarpus 441]|uniref:Uncharacterized protein n=1 Tax=Pisolithus microcarpus 441 TaxID=765257 RepID=A0A0C9ZSW8_9AGAM|nr:hypothetical protein BKA83DRAFT_350046 [Pisolithus microcarpus]KIK25357.1 hypothetical protein PISMIDRAFT_350046 [Pisolithus microcarpus 441]